MPTWRRAPWRLTLAILLHSSRGEESVECDGWARTGECKANPDFMQQHCPLACRGQPVIDPNGEIEQCAGWADQGECTRNPKFMMVSCPKACAAQRASAYDSLLDDDSRCIDLATPHACNSSSPLQANVRSRCKGTCALYHFCDADADPPECRKALRCRELKDEVEDCASAVRSKGCDAYALKRCYLSCARHDLGGLLRQYRSKVAVRTRKYGLLDEDSVSRSERRPHLSCWRGTPFDERPAATCENQRSAFVMQLRRRREPRCTVLRDTTPRAGSRRVLPLSPRVARELPEQHTVSVMPVLLAPKVRLVEQFLTAEEASHVIEVGLPRMHRSLAGGRTESIRTSTTAMLPASDRVVRAITERAAYLTGYPYANIEPLQLVKYTPGQEYKPHFDYGEACDYEENMQNGHRHVTMLVYLNSVPEHYEGHTTFPNLHISVSPTAYSAVVFNDCLPNGQEDPRTLHGGSPPNNGTKIAINIWIRASSWSMRRS